MKTDLWIPFLISQPSAETEGATGENVTLDQGEEQEEAFLALGEEPNSHAQAMSCPDASFWEDTEAYELSQITKFRTYKLILLREQVTVVVDH